MTVPGWFELRGAILALAWFCLLNLSATAAAACAARYLARRTPSRSSRFWFALRMFPAAAAILFVGVIFIPSYLQFEPRDVGEGFDVALTAAAAAAALAFVIAAARGAAAWRRASRRTRTWMRSARPLTLAGTTMTAFEIDADAPVLALVGVLRPRLLITRGLIRALTAEELSAAVAHEMGHARAWDNVKRLAMCAAPDILPRSAVVEALERQWAASAERCADDAASGRDAGARCALASALVKVARLMPPAPPLTEPVSTLISGGDIDGRVRRLLDDRLSATSSRVARTAGWAGGLAALAALVVAYGPILRAVHEATEVLVHSLP